MTFFLVFGACLTAGLFVPAPPSLRAVGASTAIPKPLYAAFQAQDFVPPQADCGLALRSSAAAAADRGGTTKGRASSELRSTATQATAGARVGPKAQKKLLHSPKNSIL